MARPPPRSTLFPYTTLFRSLQPKLVHRDIRPSNIILANDAEFGQRLVLIDWGCAVEEGAHELYAGSRAYAADRKSTRLNSSHVKISYAVFCLKKKKARRDLH